MFLSSVIEAGLPPKRTMKRNFTLFLVLVFVMSLTACGSKQEETSAPEGWAEIKSESISEEVEEEISGTNEDGIGEEISGINDDGMGEDSSFGEGIGEVIALSEAEKNYMAAQTTDTWLEMSVQEKEELVVLIGRWMEEVTGYIVEDYDEMVIMLNRQMEQYYRNGVNEAVVRTAGDIYSVALPLDDPALPVGDRAPSGINEDGMGEDPSYGEGIGEVLALTPDEESYMLAQTTDTWLEMTQVEKDDLVVLVGRSLEASDGFIVPDYEELVLMLDHQMEQYYRNGVNENVLDTVRDLYGMN